ncbi:MAG: S8 family peptidase [Xanthobacteraceae bacterium]
MTIDLDASLNAIGYAKVIVALKPQMALARTAAAEAELDMHFVLPDETQVARLAAVAERAASKKFRRAQALTRRKVRVYPHLGLALGYVNRQGSASLAADNRVDAMAPASEMRLIRPVEVKGPGRATSAPTWGLTRLKVPQLWAAGLTGEGVLVGHLDTGIDGWHSALRDAIDEFAEFDWAGDRVPGAKPWDSDEVTPAHGTHTAGTIAGRPTAKGTVGVAPGAKLASGMVIEGGQVIDRIIAGMEWVVSKGARVLSMSLGLPGFTPAFEILTTALRNQNVLPVIAVGNEGPNSSRSPGNYDNVLSVGAMSRQNIVADFSGSQAFQRTDDPLVPDLAAPGVDVTSCAPSNRYAEMSGSSMATPHVAGLAALLLQAKPTATVNELEQAILSSCQLPSGMLKERANRGVPDAVAAFTILTGRPPVAVARRPAAKTTRRRRKRAPTAKVPRHLRGARSKRPPKRRAAAGRSRRRR